MHDKGREFRIIVSRQMEADMARIADQRGISMADIVRLALEDWIGQELGE